MTDSSTSLPWTLRYHGRCRQIHPVGLTTIPGDRETPCSTAHSGSHGSTAHPPQCPRTARIGPRGLAEQPRRGSHAVLRWGARPAPPIGIRVAVDSTGLPVFRLSCLPVSHYGINL